MPPPAHPYDRAVALYAILLLAGPGLIRTWYLFHPDRSPLAAPVYLPLFSFFAAPIALAGSLLGLGLLAGFRWRGSLFVCLGLAFLLRLDLNELAAIIRFHQPFTLSDLLIQTLRALQLLQLLLVYEVFRFKVSPSPPSPPQSAAVHDAAGPVLAYAPSPLALPPLINTLRQTVGLYALAIAILTLARCAVGVRRMANGFIPGQVLVGLRDLVAFPYVSFLIAASLAYFLVVWAAHSFPKPHRYAIPATLLLAGLLDQAQAMRGVLMFLTPPEVFRWSVFALLPVLALPTLTFLLIRSATTPLPPFPPSP